MIMKTLKLILLLFIPFTLKAQIIDDSAVDQINNGEVDFMQGEFVAYLADTTSPEFAELELTRMGFEISRLDFRPVTVIILNFPSDETLQKMKADPDIAHIIQLTSLQNTERILDSLQKKGMTDLEISRAMKALQQEKAGGTYRLELDFAFNKTNALEKMKNYEGIAWEIMGDSPRLVNIKAEPGNEAEVMNKAEQLPFVEYTALIGMLRE